MKPRHITENGFKIYCRYDELLPLDQFKPHPDNPNTHPHEQIELLADIFKNNGIRQPIKVSNLSGFIIAGHGRLRAAALAGLTVYPVEFQNYEDKKAELDDLLGDNKIAELSELDADLLHQAVKNAGLDLSDLQSVGFSDEEITKLFDDHQDDLDSELADELPPEEEVQPRTKKGDIWQLGQHRLMCGDSTNLDDVKKLLNGEKVDVLITDPPYNVAYEGKTKEKLTIQNDKMSGGAFREFLTQAFKSANEAMKPGAAFYIWHATREDMNFKAAAANVGFDVKQTLVWVKNTMVLGRQDYQWKHEPCLYGWKDGASHYFIDDRTQTTVFEDEKPEFNKMKKEELVRLLEEVYSDKISTSVIYEKKPARNAEHPTMKPVKLIARLIKNSAKLNDTVLDLFGGSGTTLIAAEQLARRCFMMEFDEHYCDVILTRWENLTGQTAERIDNQD